MPGPDPARRRGAPIASIARTGTRPRVCLVSRVMRLRMFFVRVRACGVCVCVCVCVCKCVGVCVRADMSPSRTMHKFNARFAARRGLDVVCACVCGG